MGRQNISVLCPTGHPGPLVAASLKALRDVVDEIIIAADDRVGVTDLAYYAVVADVLLRYEHAGPNRHWSWLAGQASCDWVLILDGDEIAGEALIAALPELIEDRRVRQYSLPIHWVWPTAATWLTGDPWGTDRRLRLLRNDAGLTFAGRKHALAHPNPPIRYLDELPVYHLDLVLAGEDRRDAKVARYENELFGMLTPEGEPFNEAFYLPESRPEPPATTPLPAVDAERIARALDAPRDSSRALDPNSLPLTRTEQLFWFAPRNSLPEDAYRATIRLARPLPAFTAGRPDHQAWVEIANEGTARWPGGEVRDPLIRLGMYWQPIGGGERHDIGRTMLPHALDPGERTLVPLTLSGPPESGPAELVLDLVHEFVRWFEDPFVEQVEVGASVDERLTDLSERHGPLIPLEAATSERRAIAIRDGLLRQDPPDASPSDPEIAVLTADLAVGSWAVDAATLDRLAELVRTKKPTAIAEFGSGTSTIVLAKLLAEQGPDGASLVSFEENPAWAEHTRAALAERGLDGVATIIHLPIGDRQSGPPGYLMTEEAIQLLDRLAPELILVDGPTLKSGASRLAAVEIVAPHLRDDATILLDDALRDAELAVAEAWQRRDDVTIHGIRPTPKGLLEGTVRAPRRRLLRPLRRRRGVRVR